MYTLKKKKVTKVIIVTDQTKKKREEGEKRDRAAVIVAPTGSGDEVGKERDERTADNNLPRVQRPRIPGEEVPRE